MAHATNNVVSTTLFLRCEVWDSGVRLLDFRRASFDSMIRDLGALDWVKKMSWRSASEKLANFKDV